MTKAARAFGPGGQAAGKHGLVWVASYPRSGNTWTRILLANFLSRQREPVSINALNDALPGTIASSRNMFDRLVGLKSSDLAADEVDSLLPAAYQVQAERATRFGVRIFHKVHDACRDTSAGQPLFPADATAGAIYLVRNPLDIAVSWTFYTGRRDFDNAVKMLTRGHVAIGGSRDVLQHLLNWSSHVESWTSAPFPVLAVRYEDLLADAAGQLAAMGQFLGVEADADGDRVRQAVSFSEFKRLREDEAENGFADSARTCREFFRSGTAGQWRQHLTAKQVAEVVRANKHVMKEWGYWD